MQDTINWVEMSQFQRLNDYLVQIWNDSASTMRMQTSAE